MSSSKFKLPPLLLIFTLLIAGFARAQVAPIWSSTWTSVGHVSDAPQLVRATPDGGAMVVVTLSGSSVSALEILRFGADGSLLWQQQDCAPAAALAIFASEIPPVELMIANDGTAVMAAVCVDINGARQLKLKKFALVSGALIWQVQRDLSPSGSSMRSPLLARDAAANRIVVAVDDLGDYVVLRYDEAGQPSAEIRSGANNRIDIPTAIGLQADGGIVVTGLEQSPAQLGYRTVGFNSDGSERFVDRLVGVTPSVSGLAFLSIDAQGEITLAASPESQCGLTELAVYRLSASGQRLWTRMGDGPCSNSVSERPQLIQALADQSVLVVSDVSRGGQPGGITLQRITASGQRVWRRSAPISAELLEGAAVDFSAARVRAVGRAGMAEWNFNGTLCQSTAQAFRRDARVIPNGNNWLVAHVSAFSPLTNEDLKLNLYPGVACVDDALFADGYE
jgi:hypothetical protein